MLGDFKARTRYARVGPSLTFAIMRDWVLNAFFNIRQCILPNLFTSFSVHFPAGSAHTERPGSVAL